MYEGHPESKDHEHTCATCRHCLGLSFFHPPYSPDLAPSDFHLITHFKKFLGCMRLRIDEAVKNMLKKTGPVDQWQISMIRNLSHNMTRTESSRGVCRKMI